MEEVLHDMPVFREFAKLDEGAARLPDETTILRFRHPLEKHDLATDMLRVVNDILQARGLMMKKGTVVDATLIAAPSPTKDVEGARDASTPTHGARRFGSLSAVCAEVPDGAPRCQLQQAGRW